MMQELKSALVVKGLTLVELMVALALSSFLVIGIFQIYSTSRITDNVGAAVGRVQETGRIVLDLLAKDLRLVGYHGCIDPRTMTSDMITVAAANVTIPDVLETALRGFEVASGWADGTEFDGADIEADAREGTDVIAIRRMQGAGIQLAAEDLSGTSITIASNPLNIKKDSVVLVANCAVGHLFRVTNNVSASESGHYVLEHDVSGNVIPVFDTRYNATNTVMNYVSLAYFVKDTGRTATDGEPIHALYRQYDTFSNGGGNVFEEEELVEGVESIQIQYGERLENGRVRFVSADTADLDMLNVESVRIAILVSSAENVLQVEDGDSYSLLDATVSASDNADSGLTHLKDKRIRQVFTGTINLRNRPISKDS